MMCKGYDMSHNETEGKASRKRALTQSIKKWMMLSTVPAKGLENEWHGNCALCDRYNDLERCSKKRLCPLFRVKSECKRSESPFHNAYLAYRDWCRNKSLKNFRACRKAARAMLGALNDAYTELYSEEYKEIN